MELPADVLKAATDLSDTITLERQVSEQSMSLQKWQTNMIVRALLAERISATEIERERCAKIAEAHKLGDDSMLVGTGRWAVHEGACIEIAAAIRSQP